MPDPIEGAVAGTRRVLHCARFFYFDSSNGAAVANRALMEGLARRGFPAEVVCGPLVDAGAGDDPTARLAALGIPCESSGGGGPGDPPRVSARVGGVPVTVLRRPLRGPGEADPVESGDFLALAEAAFDRLRPEVLVTYGGDPLTLDVLARARRRGIANVFTLHNFNYTAPEPFADVDLTLVASRFSAMYHRRRLGGAYAAIPYLVDVERARAGRREGKYVTFVNPSYEKGVYVFARVADELGRRRPDIPLLVVEGRGDERTLADCGLDLRAHGNVDLMANTGDPRRFWEVTKVCLLPSLWLENQPLVAVEAMLNGIPVVGSDRGGIPEALGDAGVVLPLPPRLTPSTRELPTAEEVAPWVDEIVRLWDDAGHYAERSRRALDESRRWDPGAIEPLYVKLFSEVRPRPRPEPAPLPAPSDAAAEDRAAVRTSRRPIEAGLDAIRKRWPGLGDDYDDDPVFVLAAGWRSGSTMLQRLLVGAGFLWGEPFGHAGLIDSLADPIRGFTDRWPENHHFYQGQDADRLGRTFIANLYPGMDDLLASHRAYFERLFAGPARRAGAPRWGLKEVRLEVDHAVYLQWLFPRAKFLFLIRNPYDAWRSYAARAARGWKWYNRWPDEPVTVRSFARHWRRLTSGFLADHAKVDGLVVRYESLARGEYAEVERHLGFPLSPEAGRANPSDGGPPPLGELLGADRAALDEELGPLAASLGYAPGRGAEPPRTSAAALAAAGVGPSMDPAVCVVLVPVGHHIEPACEDGLRALEARGYTVRRVRGYSAIDQGRNQIATNAIREGFEEVMWIDSDIAFQAESVERLRGHGLPITCGVYAKKGTGSFACNFPAGMERVAFGDGGGLVEVPYAGAGFLHTRREVYEAIQERLRLVSCNERFGPSMVPFFLPMIVPDGPGHWYLAEDFAFCHRARSCGFRILADTAIRLKHIGTYAYAWEDAGGERQRYSNYMYYIHQK